MLVGDAALRVDEETFGNTPGAVIDGDLAGFVLAVGIGDIEFLQKLARLLVGVLHGNAEKNHILVFDFLPGGFELLRFFTAGHAPGGPEIDEHRFAAQIVQGEFAAVEESDRERRRRLRNQRRNDVVRVAGKTVGEQREAPAR